MYSYPVLADPYSEQPWTRTGTRYSELVLDEYSQTRTRIRVFAAAESCIYPWIRGMSWSIRLNSMLGNLPPNGRFSRQILESALNLPAENGRWKIYLPFRLFETGVKWKILGEMQI